MSNIKAPLGIVTRNQGLPCFSSNAFCRGPQGAQHGPATYEDRAPATNPCSEGPFELGHVIRAHGQKKHARPEYCGHHTGPGAPFSTPRSGASTVMRFMSIYSYVHVRMYVS